MVSLHRIYVGIDVHRAKHIVAMLPSKILEEPGSTWKLTPTFEIENTASDYATLNHRIQEIVKNPKNTAIAVDQTGLYSAPLVNFLLGKGYPVYYLEPRATKAARINLFDRESKGDIADAVSFAHLLYLSEKHGMSFRIYPVQTRSGDNSSVLRTLVLQRMQYSRLISQMLNRLRQMYYVIFPEAEGRYTPALLKVIASFPSPKDIIRAAKTNKNRKWQKLDERLKKKVLPLAQDSVGVADDEYRDAVLFFAQLLEDSLSKRDALDERIRAEVTSHPYGSILLSFPSMSVQDAALLISVIKDIHRWANDRKLKKALGVYPVLIQSGTRLHRTESGREGDRYARGALFRIVMTSLTKSAPQNDLRDYFVRSVARGKPGKKAMWSTCGKLAEIIFHCLSVNEPYQYQGIFHSSRVSDKLREKYYRTEQPLNPDEPSLSSV